MEKWNYFLFNFDRGMNKRDVLYVVQSEEKNKNNDHREKGMQVFIEQVSSTPKSLIYCLIVNLNAFPLFLLSTK